MNEGWCTKSCSNWTYLLVSPPPPKPCTPPPSTQPSSQDQNKGKQKNYKLNTFFPSSKSPQKNQGGGVIPNLMVRPLYYLIGLNVKYQWNSWFKQILFSVKKTNILTRLEVNFQNWYMKWTNFSFLFSIKFFFTSYDAFTKQLFSPLRVLARYSFHKGVVHLTFKMRVQEFNWHFQRIIFLLGSLLFYLNSIFRGLQNKD